MTLSWLFSLFLLWGCRSHDGRWATLVGTGRETPEHIAALPYCLDGCRLLDGHFVGTIHPECDAPHRKGTGLWQCADDIPLLPLCPSSRDQDQRHAWTPPGCRRRDGAWVTADGIVRNPPAMVAELPFCVEGCRSQDGILIGASHPECDRLYRIDSDLWQCWQDIPHLPLCPPEREEDHRPRGGSHD